MEGSRWARGGPKKQLSQKFTASRLSSSSPPQPPREKANDVSADRRAYESSTGACSPTGMLIGSHVSTSVPDKRPQPRETDIPKADVPKVSVTNEATNHAPPKSLHHPDRELDTIFRIVRRLRWKTAALSCSFDRARTSGLVGEAEAHGNRLEGLLEDPHLAGLAMDPLTFLPANGTPNYDSHNTQDGASHGLPEIQSNGACNNIQIAPKSMAAHAESMFKLDFFEYYNLLERALTVCYSICHVHVSRSHDPLDSNQPTRSKSASDANGADKDRNSGADFIFSTRGRTSHPSEALLKSRFAGQHRYHAAVLDALDLSNNPLKPVLGEGTTRYWLGVAKDLRNRWKDADEQREINGSPSRENGASNGNAQAWHSELRNLELGTMISTILLGIEHAVGVVERELEQRKNQKAGNDSDGRSSQSLFANDSDMMDADVIAEYGIETVEDGMDID
ncbi:MAG: hypothetical protein M1831_004843 [Alyxoria varia]|nr:MAG: hypothetical protein M1831_004843 [Alyxoria varia]